MADHLLKFADGPAEGQEIRMSVEPQERRWYLQAFRHTDDKVLSASDPVQDWWVFQEPVIRDNSIVVTQYRLHSSDDDVHTYRMEDEWGR